ncbi:hypothetical protein N865_13340 [Intrasporangium oryzae NRRL B-24470]|uniref:Uncharacterized protein n=1 Tax=Intrasporangium oryzae NRRL B-24470 TaxID=1386089 RepID=W9G7P9_9MICO|nr:hypothetical protein [Intrasporangium oryzae]EWT00848.1 hypothetical protein N865_13340 [Intrasporangium oryzae NRRL B-24470]
MTEGAPGAPPSAAPTLRALARARSTSRELSDQLLTHLPDLGDLPTQRALDAWVEQAADTLRALSEAVEERLLDLGRRPGPGPSPESAPHPAPLGHDVTAARDWTAG